MERVLFQRAGHGFSPVRGELVRAVQAGLLERGSDPGPIDGIFGNFTESAVRDWQRRAGRAETGRVVADEWTELTGREVPVLFERALQLTAAFEGHGFRLVAGNFDGAGLTWGVIGFTLRHCELQKILSAALDSGDVVDAAFGPLADELRDVLARDLAAQMRWAESISVGSRRYKVRSDWAAAFDRLGGSPEVQRLQLQRAREVYWRRATRDAEELDLKTELGLALCFDIAVQNGGVDFRELERIRFRWRVEPPTGQRSRRITVANVVAEGSRPRWVEDVRARKLTLALGQGSVHGARYEVTNWALDDSEVSEDV